MKFCLSCQLSFCSSFKHLFDIGCRLWIDYWVCVIFLLFYLSHEGRAECHYLLTVYWLFIDNVFETITPDQRIHRSFQRMTQNCIYTAKVERQHFSLWILKLKMHLDLNSIYYFYYQEVISYSLQISVCFSFYYVL